MTNQAIPPCPVCGTAPKHSTTIVDYRGSITCVLLTVPCTCLIEAQRIGGEVSTNHWEQLCDEYLGRALRASGIETIAQLNARFAPDPRVAFLDELGVRDKNNLIRLLSAVVPQKYINEAIDRLIAAQRGEGV